MISCVSHSVIKLIALYLVFNRDCNPGLEFSIPGFGIVEFPIPGSRDPVGIGGLLFRLLKLPRGLR